MQENHYIVLRKTGEGVVEIIASNKITEMFLDEDAWSFAVCENYASTERLFNYLVSVFGSFYEKVPGVRCPSFKVAHRFRCCNLFEMASEEALEVLGIQNQIFGPVTFDKSRGWGFKET